MTCPTCGHENQPDAHFCASCGSPLEVTCPSCGRANPRGTRYCASCGLQLTDAAGVVEGHPPEPPESPDRIPPRDVGELIGETFRVYRQSFWPFVLIALIPQAPSVASVLAGLDSVPFILVLGLVGVFLSILAGGASVSAVVDQHLGRPIDVWGCYKRAWNRVLSLVVVFLVVSLALAGSGLLMIIIVGIPLFFWLLVV